MAATTEDTYLHRVVAVLGAFRAEEDAVGAAELARRTGLPRSTVHRIVLSLVEEGMLERHGSEVRLGLRLFEIGQRVPRQRALRDAARPYMSDLREATRQTIHLAVLEGGEVVYVDILASPGGPPLPSRVGGRLPAHATGVGKAILAFSPQETVRTVLEGRLTRLSERSTVRTVSWPGSWRGSAARASRTTTRSRAWAWSARPAPCWAWTARCWAPCRSRAGAAGCGWTTSPPPSTPRHWPCPEHSATASPSRGTPRRSRHHSLAERPVPGCVSSLFS
jgi:DNA-binding IclR family transcriptional regulator